jgi:transposase, IS30 family
MKRYQHLSDEERLYIQHSLRAGKTKKQIAIELDRHPSTISRETHRNMFPSAILYTHYWACYLNRWRKRTKYSHLSRSNTKIKGELADKVATLLRQYLSPEQVSSYLKRHHRIEVSHEAIYRHIYSDKTRKHSLKPFLRQGQKKRRKAYGSGARASRIPNRIPISARPQIVNEKRRIGDWECDTVIGKDRKSALVTVVERKSLFTVMAVVKRKTADQVCRAMIKILKPYAKRVKTLTFDNGSEFILHERIGKALSAKTYFANPYASWERGINENTNGLIRQFFPKSTDFNNATSKEIKNVLALLNNRPRKTRKNKSPNEIFNNQFIPLIT